MRSDRTAGAGSHRAVWRLHLLSGLIVGPVLLVLALTGMVYLFDREIDGWWNASRARINGSGPSLALPAQEAAVLAEMPGASIKRIVLPDRSGIAAEWLVENADGERMLLFVDPRSGTITGSADPAWQPTAIARRLHGELLSGDAGSYVVELVASMTLVMVATGLYLWWPRSWRLGGVLVPRLRGGHQMKWRDLHAVPAMLSALFLAFLVITGMPWSVFWGAQFARLGTQLPAIAPSPNFAEHVPARHDATHAGVPWSIQHGPVPHEHSPEHAHHAQSLAGVEPHLARIDTSLSSGRIRIFYPGGDGDPFMVSWTPDRAQAQRTLYIGAQTGELIADIGWNDYSPAARIVEWGVMTHMGRQYGAINQWLNLGFCIGIVGAVIAGLRLWWIRRPPASLGGPQLSPHDRFPRGLLVLLIAIGLLFPLAGAALLLIAAAERLLFRRQH